MVVGVQSLQAMSNFVRLTSVCHSHFDALPDVGEVLVGYVSRPDVFDAVVLVIWPTFKKLTPYFLDEWPERSAVLDGIIVKNNGGLQVDKYKLNS